MKIAMCTELFKEHSFKEICCILHDIGYTGAELAPFQFGEDIRELSQDKIREIRQTAEEFSLELTAFHWLLVSPPDLHITNPDPKITTETQNFFTGLIDFAADLNISRLVFGSPNQRNIPSNVEYSDWYDHGVMFFQKMADYSAARNVIIAFEPLGRSITNFGATTADALDLIQDVDHKSFKLHLDASAMHRDDLSIQEQLDLVAKTPEVLEYVHLNDENQLGPGMGDNDLKPLLSEIIKMGYNGWFSVEAFKDDVPIENIAKESYKYVAETLSELMKK